MLWNLFVNLTLGQVCWSKTLWNVFSIASIVFCIDFIILSPPLGIYHRVQASGSDSFLGLIMGVVNLKSCLRAISWYGARCTFWTLASPWRWCFLRNFNAISILESLMIHIIGCWSLLWHYAILIYNSYLLPILIERQACRNHIDCYLLMLAWPWVMSFTRTIIATVRWLIYPIVLFLQTRMTLCTRCSLKT